MEKHCRILLGLIALCALLQALFFVLSWSLLLPADFFMQMSADGLSAAQLRTMAAGQRAAGALLSLPALLTLMYGLLRLRRMLGNVGRRLLFDAATIDHLRVFAGAVLASTFLATVEPAVRAIVFRYGFGDTRVTLSMGVGSAEIVLVLVCSLFYVVTGMMHEARRLAEENEGFV